MEGRLFSLLTLLSLVWFPISGTEIVKICNIASPTWIKIVDFRLFLHFRVEIPVFRVTILKLQIFKKGSTKISNKPPDGIFFLD